LRPPERLKVSEWADKYRDLPRDDHPKCHPKWHTSFMPYLKDIMDAFNDREIEEIWVCAATQVGKTEAILNMIGYSIDQAPAPILVVYPTEDLARNNSRNRIQDMIERCEVLACKRTLCADDFSLFEMHFINGATLALAWANSAPSLASRPIKYLFLDEVDKFPKSIGREGDAVELALERTKSYWDRKIVGMSTPTTEDGRIWQALESADVVFRYYVPCPLCGHEQILRFEQLRWPQELNQISDVRENTWYECEKCKGSIRSGYNDQVKNQMIKLGHWRPDRNVKGSVRYVAFHLPTFYSPFVSFGQIAEKFLRSKDYPQQLQNLISSIAGSQSPGARIIQISSSTKPSLNSRSGCFLTNGEPSRRKRFC